MNKLNQASPTVLMIRPARFGYNPQTAVTNLFQKQGEDSFEEIHIRAVNEFNAFVKRLQEHSIEVVVFEDTLEPHKPDAIFPNNWISFHEDGKLVLYPMHAPNRREERRADVLVSLQQDYGLDIKEIFDFSSREKEERFLEGTGSIVFDYQNRIAYACLSPRTDAELLDIVCKYLGYKAVVFHAKDQGGHEIYHTNVMMCIGEGFAVVCMESIEDPKQRLMVRKELEATGHEIVEISYAQLNSFAGNMLQVQNALGVKYLITSQTAYDSLTPQQIRTISKHTQLLPINVNTIEQYGGGSVRCMLAGVFLPKGVED